MSKNKSSSKAKKGPAPATLRYATTAARTTLGDGDEDVTVEEADGVAEFACRGVPYATLRVEDNEVVVTLRKPLTPAELEPKLKLYRKAARSGWLEWRTSVSRDPKPWLEADVGSMIGQTQYEILHGKHSS